MRTWVLLLLLVACAQGVDTMDDEVMQHDMTHGMPCHQMPDGSWMGDCKETLEQASGLDANHPMRESSTIIDVSNGDTVSLSADMITARVHDREITMMGYNKQVPGPAFKAHQGDRITVEFTNNLNQETTVHWHGLRHDVRFDGVPGISQETVKPGEMFSYEVYFPDEGIYWYHPHVREDIQQDLGLAGNLLVIPTDPEYFNPVNYEEMLVLDDILLGEDGVVTYGEEHANFAIMGRFGNYFLVNGQEHYDLSVNKGDVVRFYITNIANVRPYLLSIPGAQIKLVGGDMGKYEREEYVDSVLLTPAERAIIEVHFPSAGTFDLIHSTPDESYSLGSIVVGSEQSDDSHEHVFEELRVNSEIVADIGSFEQYFNKEPDYTIELTVDMPMMGGMMHGMDDMPCHQMPDGSWMGDCGNEDDHVAETIEWEDNMFMMNSRSTTNEVQWILRDADTGLQNMDIDMRASIGDKIKIRLFNDPESMHPMQHPFHLHGQRFLVTHIDGEPVDNKVWKDTVLVPIGSTVDILVDVTNPGEWMMHCHIAEHLEAGMMSTLVVE